MAAWSVSETLNMDGRQVQASAVLIIEDDTDIREGLSQILVDEGFHVLTAPNGLAGLEVLRQRVPALILLDLMMPVMNGWQFRQRQLSDPELARIPVVIISADSGGRREAENLGSEDFLQKPIELDVLLRLVEHYCVRADAKESA
jgi:CheY-like chemotaxis protein